MSTESVKVNENKVIMKIVLMTTLMFTAVASAALSQTRDTPVTGISAFHVPAGDETVSGTVAVDLYEPPKGTKISGDMLVLPGWKFSRTRWYRETDLLDWCGKMGIRAAFPEMTVTCYESRYFPETRMKWAGTPGGEWIRSILIPYMNRKYGMFEKGARNYLLGLSTGGRGVLLVALRNPGIFSACATLSGDCDQSRMPGDRLMTAIYGPYEQHRLRWKNVDNPIASILKGEWVAPIYIGHGKSDGVSPYSQSRLLYETISNRPEKIKAVFSDPAGGGHDFNYWRSEVPAIMKFFDRFGAAE